MRSRPGWNKRPSAPTTRPRTTKAMICRTMLTCCPLSSLEKTRCWTASGRFAVLKRVSPRDADETHSQPEHHERRPLAGRLRSSRETGQPHPVDPSAIREHRVHTARVGCSSDVPQARRQGARTPLALTESRVVAIFSDSQIRSGRLDQREVARYADVLVTQRGLEGLAE
jgi:hypothetical protein